MLRDLNIKNNEDICILYKNNKEELCEISREYIDNVIYKLTDCNSLELTITNKVVSNGITVDNPLFDNILGKRQKIRFNDEMYVITDCQRNDTIDKKEKKVSCLSLESIIDENELYLSSDITRHLRREQNSLEISDGILDMFEKENPDWTIGNVDTTLLKEKITLMREFEIGINGSSYKGLSKGTTIVDSNININIDVNDNDYINLKFVYGDIESKDITGKVLKNEKIVHSLGNFHTKVKNIKVEYVSTDSFWHCAKYTITFDDNSKRILEFNFTDIEGYDVDINDIRLIYSSSGIVEEGMHYKYRTFEQGVYGWLSFLRNSVEEAFDCIFIFDTLNRIVHCYDRGTFGKDTNLMLSYENYIKGINKRYQYDDIITKLYVESDQEGVTIYNENPLGTDYLLNFDYFIKHKIMSDKCSSAWLEYEKSIDGIQNQLYLYRTELYNLNAKRIKIDTQITTINNTIKSLEVIRVSFIKSNSGSDMTRLTIEINAKQDEVKQCLKDLAFVRSEINRVERNIDVIVNSIFMDKATYNGRLIFDSDDLEEIRQLTISDTYSDKYFLTGYGLYNEAKTLLAERNKLQIDFDINLVGLLEKIIIPTGKVWNEMLTLGDYIYVEDKELNDLENKIRIVEIAYSPKENKINKISFTNKLKPSSSLKSIGNIGRKVTRVDNYTTNYRGVWEKAIGVSAYIDSVMKDGMDARASSIKSRSARCKFDMTECGLFVIDNDGENEDNQIYVGSSMICITDDRWNTCRTAIDAKGVIAEEIVGKMILGKNLYIENTSGSLTVDEDGMTIMSDKLKIIGLGDKASTLTSFFNFLKDEISLGVTDTKKYADAQIKITEDTIKSTVSKTYATKDEVGDFINNIVVEYMLHDSMTNPPSDTDPNWSTTAPEHERGKYMWSRIRTIKASGDVEYGVPTCIQGADGDTAKYVILNSEQIFKQEGDIILPATITISSEVFGVHETINYQWYYKKSKDSSFTEIPVNANASTFTVNPNDVMFYPNGNNSCTFKLVINNDDLVSDQITIAKVKDGVDGFGGRTIHLNGERVFKYAYNSNSGSYGLPSPENIMLSVITENVKNPTYNWTYKNSLGMYIPITGANTSSNTLSISHNNIQIWEGRTNIVIRVEVDSLVDEMSISKIYDGAKGDRGDDGTSVKILGSKDSVNDLPLTGNNIGDMYVVGTNKEAYVWNGSSWDNLGQLQGAKGDSGDDAYTVMLSNENITIPVTNDNKCLEDFTTTVVPLVYEGIKPATTYNVSKPSNANGIIVTQNPDKSLVFSCSKDTSITSNYGDFTISILVGSLVFVKTFTWSVSKSGADGEDAKYVIVSGEQVFKYSSTNVVSPTSVTLTANEFGFDSQPTYKWEYKKYGDTTWNLVSSTKTITILPDNAMWINPTVTAITFRCTLNGISNIYDEMTVFKVKDGVDGSPGIQGVSYRALGEWSSTKSYVNNTSYIDTVVYGGGSYYCKMANTNVYPTNTTYWGILSEKGKDGTGSKYIMLTGEQIFLYDKDYNGTPNPERILLTATSYNTEDDLYKWYYKSPSGDFILINGEANSTMYVPHNANYWGNDKQMTFKVECDGVSDETTICKVANGKDSYTILLDNEAITIPTDNSLVTATNISFTITPVVYYGGTNPTYTIATPSSDGGGITVSKTSNSQRVIISVPKDTTLTKPNGSVYVPVVVDGFTFNKYVSWSVSKSGLNGEDAYTVILNNESHTISTGSDGYVTTEMANTASTGFSVYKRATPLTPNAVASEGFYSLTITKMTGCTAEIIGSGINPRTLRLTGMSDNDASVTVTVDCERKQTITKMFTISKAMRGEEGVGYTILLSNETVSIPYSSDGGTAFVDNLNDIYTGFIVYKGSKRLVATTNQTPSSGQYSVSLKVSSDGALKPISIEGNDYVARLQSLEQDIDMATFLFEINCENIQIGSKLFTVSKSKSGTDGRIAKITSSQDTFSTEDGGSTWSPSSIQLIPSFQNVSFLNWQYSLDGSAWANLTGTLPNGISIHATTKILTLQQNCILYSNTQHSIHFRLMSTYTLAYDIKSISRVYVASKDLYNNVMKNSTEIEQLSDEVAIRAKSTDLDATNTRLSELNLKVDSFTIDFTGTSNNMCPDSNLRAFQEGRTSPSWGWWATAGSMKAGDHYYGTMSGHKYRGWSPSINGQNGNINVYVDGVEPRVDYRIEFDYFLESNTYGSIGHITIFYYDNNGNRITSADQGFNLTKGWIYRPTLLITAPPGCSSFRVHFEHPGTNGGSNSLLYVGTIMITKGKNSYVWQPKSDELSSANFSMRPNGEFTITTGSGSVVLSAEGIPNCYSTSVVDNCDTDNPCNLTFFIDREINRVDRCKLFLSSEWFRAYSKAARDSGAFTSWGGGSSAQTSTASGDHRHDMFHVDYPVSSTGAIEKYVSDADNNTIVIKTLASDGSRLRTRSSSGNHSHVVYTPDHTHGVPGHTHGIDYGLYEENPNSQIHWEVYIDGNRFGNYFSDGDEIDVSSWITTSGRHTIRTVPRQAGTGNYIRARCTIALDIKTLQNGR